MCVIIYVCIMYVCKTMFSHYLDSLMHFRSTISNNNKTSLLANSEINLIDLELVTIKIDFFNRRCLCISNKILHILHKKAQLWNAEMYLL